MKAKVISAWQYMNSYIGKLIDFDQAFGFQCVDLARKFASDIGNPTNSFGGSAIVGWNSGAPFNNTKWRRVVNSPSAVPKPGDIIFFDKTWFNKSGHVALVYEATASYVVIEEQNGGTGTGAGGKGDRVRLRKVGYTRMQNLLKSLGPCVGWYEL